MTGQPHAAMLFVLIMLMIVIAVALHGGVEGWHARALSDDAWVCASKLDSLNCFLATLTR